MFEVMVERGRTLDWDYSLTESDGTTSLTLASGDVVRCKVYRRNGTTPLIDIDSAGPTSAGSVITVNELGPSPTANVTVRFHQDDTSGLDFGVYDCEVAYVDVSDGDVIQTVDVGVCYIMPSGGGDIGST